MSLLMDALKKAEQEKKAAAESLREAQGKSPEDKLSQQPARLRWYQHKNLAWKSVQGILIRKVKSQNHK